MPKLVSIVYKPKDHAQPGDGFLRVPLQSAELVEGHGIEGDAKGGTPSRHLNIMVAENLADLEAAGFNTRPGAMGEQLIVEGLILESLPQGTRVQIGESAIVLLDTPRSGCATFERHQELSRDLAARKLGMMAEVVTGGRIQIGDEVRVLP
jgi:MOSC domain-containing protein YiiM